MVPVSPGGAIPHAESPARRYQQRLEHAVFADMLGRTAAPSRPGIAPGKLALIAALATTGWAAVFGLGWALLG